MDWYGIDQVCPTGLSHFVWLADVSELASFSPCPKTKKNENKTEPGTLGCYYIK